MATRHVNPENHEGRQATDDEIPPGIRRLLPMFEELLREGTRLLGMKADYWEAKAKAVTNGRDA
jgi:hypothetical protein